MCTAISFNTKNHYFGRTLDLEYSFNENIIITPRNYKLNYKHNNHQKNNFAIIGVGIVQDDYPLYYDAINEKGVSVAGLNFPKTCKYYNYVKDKINLTSFELIPWILQNFDSINILKSEINDINITNDNFNECFKHSPLHWIVSDNETSITIEQSQNGLKILDNPIGVLTNEPSFDMQLENLTKYINLTPYEPNNIFCEFTNITPSSRGLGGFGLPGDLSSSSRFVRAAYTKLNSICDNDEVSSINQFFNILNTVKQTNGCVRLPDNKLEKTVYTTCYNTDKCILYYTTYNNSSISQVNLFNVNLDSSVIIQYNMLTEPTIIKQN